MVQPETGIWRLTRKVGLLRNLICTQLENCDSVDEYVHKIISTSHQLRNINFNISDQWVGTLLPAGLPDSYRPMIMGIESSGVNISGDSIKVKLLQEVKDQDHTNTEGSTLLAKKQLQKNKKKKVHNAPNARNMGILQRIATSV